MEIDGISINVRSVSEASTSDAPAGASARGGRFRDKFGIPFFFTFGVSFATWLVLSGKFDPFHLSLGMISCFIVAFYSSDIMITTDNPRRLPGVWMRFVMYIPWLLKEVFVANLHVMRLVFHPRMRELINPRTIRFKSRLSSDIALLTFANSITLTPGTITVFVSVLGNFTVHVIDEKSGDALPGEMEQRIARVFKE